MPKKMKLSLKDLKVQSFVTQLGDDAGKVKGGATDGTICIISCMYPCTYEETCDTCGASCGGTCAQSCNGTCNTCVTCGFSCGGTCVQSDCICSEPPQIIC